MLFCNFYVKYVTKSLNLVYLKKKVKKKNQVIISK